MSTLDTLRKQHAAFADMQLTLNMERGQPSDDNFNLCTPLLTAVDASSIITDSGVDIRNYPGGIHGLREARELFCQQIGVEPAEILIGNNSSLDLMGSILSWALLKGVLGSQRRWIDDKPKLIVTVPGYDRHFSLAQTLGYELLTVPMTTTGPDLDAVEALAADPAVKGIYFVPNYSNPTGDCLSQGSAARLVSINAAAEDFTIFADDAYAVHHLVDEPTPAPKLLALAQAAGKADRVILFGSTSKITFASGGLSFTGMSERNLAYWSKLLSVQSIGPNKIEQWRHVRFLRNYPGGMTGLMREHARILKPKFDMVQQVLSEDLEPGLARWSNPRGGYFVNVDVERPVAEQVIELAGTAGVALTPVGATYPGGNDPTGRNIRLAPTRPPLVDVEQAMRVFTCCVKLASAEYDALL